MYRIVVVVLLLFLLHSSGFSQTISGYITDTQQNALQGVSVRCYHLQSNIIQAFAITNAKGQYQFNKSFLPDSIKLVVASMGFATVERTIKKTDAIQDFILSVKDIELKEVVVKSPPIQISHDTIAYDVKQFANHTDRNLGDVLKKLPGIQISDNGIIRYNGEPINKYYTEGKDLFEGKYKIANDNFRWQDIERVEILENHQPINVLKDLVYSSKAGLNVVFRDSSKAKWIKRAEVGTGYDPNVLLYDNSLNAIKIAKKNQSFNIIKSNNVGRDLLASTQYLNIDDLMDGGPLYSFLKVSRPLLSIIDLNRPPINQNYLNFNQSHLFTAKNLWTFRKKIDVILNLEYLSDIQANEGTLQSLYYLGQDTLAVNEIQNNAKKSNQLEGTLSIIVNEPNYYFSNKMFMKANWQNTNGLIKNDETGNTQNVNQQNVFNTQWIADELKIERKTESGNLVEIKAWGYYFNAPQHLNVIRNDVAKANVFQEVRLKKSLLNFHLNFLANKKIGLNAKIGAEVSDQNLRANLTGFPSAKLVADTSLLSNIQRLSYWRTFVETGYSFNNKNIKLNINAPLSFINWFNLDKNRLIIEPNLSLTNILSSKWSTTFKYNFKYNIAEIDDYSKAFLLLNYRTIQRNTGQMPDNQRHSVSMKVYYKDILHFWFWDAMVAIGEVQSNILKEQTNDGIYIKQTTVAADNVIHNINGAIQSNKYIHSIKTKLSISTNYDARQSVGLFSNNQLATIATKTHSTTFNINSNPEQWFRFQFDINVIHSKNRVEIANQEKQNTFKQLNLKTKVDFIPNKHLTFGIEANQYKIENGQNQAQQYIMIDCSANYHFAKRNIDVGFYVQNLGNERKYQNLSFSDNSFLMTDFALRPIQVLAKLSFSF